MGPNSVIHVGFRQFQSAEVAKQEACQLALETLFVALKVMSVDYVSVHDSPCLPVQEVQELTAQVANAKKTTATTPSLARPAARPASMHRDEADMSPVTRELHKGNADPEFVAWLRIIEKVSKLLCSVCQALPATCAIAACKWLSSSRIKRC